MKPLKFKECNMTLAEDQPEYQPLPVLYIPDPGTMVSCWKLSWVERIKVLLFGKFWFQQYTFGKPLQPQLPTVEKPFKIYQREEQ